MVEGFGLHWQSVEVQSSPQPQSELPYWQRHGCFCENLELPLSYLQLALADIATCSSSETDLMMLFEAVKPGIGKARR